MTATDLPFGTVLHDFDDEYLVVVGVDSRERLMVLSVTRESNPIRPLPGDLIDAPWGPGRRRYAPLIGA